MAKKDSGGWIKLYRQIWNNDLWKDSDEPFDKRSAWIDLLLMANHKAQKTEIGGQVVTIKRGQLHTSERKLAARWGWSRGKIQRFLRTTNGTGMTTTSKSADGTTITIENYSDFQGTRTTSKTTSDTTNGTTDRARTRNKEKKNEKNAPGSRKNAPGASKKIEPPMGDPIF